MRYIFIPKRFIISDPRILTAPTNTLKIRYLILRQVAPRVEVLMRKGWFMFSQNKTYARFVYLKGEEDNVKLTQITRGETEFVKVFDVESTDLMKKYKLTQDTIYEMQKVLQEGEMEDFTEKEKIFIDKTYRG